MEQDVQIINGNSFALKGRFAGRNYVFPPDEPQRTPFPVARHIFGFGENRKDKAKTAAVLNRLGLLKLGGRYDEALAALFKVRFNSAKVVFESPLEPERPQRGPGREDDDDDEDEESGSTPARPGSPGGDAEGAEASSADLALREKRRAQMLKAREVMLANRLKRQEQEKE